MFDKQRVNLIIFSDLTDNEDPKHICVIICVRSTVTKKSTNLLYCRVQRNVLNTCNTKMCTQ